MARASRVQEAQAPAVLVDGTAIRLAEIVGNLYSNTMLVLEIRGWGSPVNGKFSTKTKDEIHWNSVHKTGNQATNFTQSNLPSILHKKILQYFSITILLPSPTNNKRLQQSTNQKKQPKRLHQSTNKEIYPKDPKKLQQSTNPKINKISKSRWCFDLFRCWNGLSLHSCILCKGCSHSCANSQIW